MAYIGKGLQDTATANITVDRMTGDNAPNGVRNTLTCSLSKAPASINDITIFVDGIQQRPGTDYTLSNWTITFSTAPQAGQNVVAVCKGASWQDYVADSTVTTEKIKDGAVTNAKLTGSIDAAKLIGTLPAIDGSALTGIVSEATIATSDPLINTNETTLGKIYINKTSGEVFVLIDATTDENIWYNVGGGVGDYGKAFGGRGGGTIAGFHAGGNTQSQIHKYSFTSDANATSHGNMTSIAYMAGACSSSTHGYSVSGVTVSNPQTNTTEKYAFASSGQNTVLGSLTVSLARQDQSGHSSSTDGYISGGVHPSGTTGLINKFSFANSNPATDHSSLTVARFDSGGVSSITHGYAVGGNVSSTLIDKFQFSSSATSTTHGSLLTSFSSRRGGHSSDDNGYVSGGAPITNVIERFSYASADISIDHSNLSASRVAHGSTSSTTHGYSSGGAPNALGQRDVIDKFAFTNPAVTASDVGDLLGGGNNSFGGQGHQY